MSGHHDLSAPSDWIVRFAPLIKPQAKILDIATGSGRHALWLADQGYQITAIDRDLSGLKAYLDADQQRTTNIELIEADLETDTVWPLGKRQFDAIIITNYLHRPLFPAIRNVMTSSGVLLYETFALGNEAYGRPSNPDFLLKPGELIKTVRANFDILGFEHGLRRIPSPAIIQRVAAVKR